MKKSLCLILSILYAFLLNAQNAKSIQEAMDSYDYATALKLIEKETNLSSKTLLCKAIALKSLHRSLEAIDVLKEVQANEPGNVQVLIELAECSKLSGRTAQATEYYKCVTELNPKHQYAQFQYARQLCNQRKYDLAKQVISELIQTDSTAVSLRLLAECYEYKKDYIKAFKIYSNIIKKYPYDYLSYLKQGAILIANEDYEGVKSLTEKYREIDTTNIEINRQNALSYFLIKNYKTAINRYSQLAAQGDSTLQTCYFLGISHYARYHYFEAHDWLERAYQINPEDVNILYYLGRACAKTSWKKEGIEHLCKAIEITIPKDSTMGRLYKGLADCYKLNSNYPEMIDALKEQLKYLPKNYMIFYKIGETYYIMEKYDEAKVYLNKFLQTKAKNQLKEEGDEEENTSYEKCYAAAERILSEIRKEKFFKK